MRIQRSLRFVAGVAGSVALFLSPALSFANSFTQTNLVSDVPGLAAVTDAKLVDPWGVAFSATSPFWISDEGSGVATLYSGAGTPNSLVVTVPGGGDPNGPTGQVFNSTTGFAVGSSPATFIFDTQNGTIAAWNGSAGTTAVTEVTTPGAMYTGLALASSGSNNYLYAANANGGINVFNSSFAPVTLAGAFTDPSGLPGYTAFNIQLIGSQLYVMYAQLDAEGNPLPGGYVDVFNTDGTFVERLTSGGPLEAPWGITEAPAGFDGLGGDFLIGNFGNGEIDAFTASGAFVETLDGPGGTPLVNSGLWSLDFRTGGTGVNTNALYFTAGIDDENEGLFGDIVPSTPEPASYLLAGSGVIFLLAAMRLRRAAEARAL